MPFFTYHSQRSWPSFRSSTPISSSESSGTPPRNRSSSRAPTSKGDADPEIDLNPFSFFISPAVSDNEIESDSEDEELFSAGIEIERTRSKSLSPIPFRNRNKDTEDSTELNFYDDPTYQGARPRSPKSALNKFIEKHTDREDDTEDAEPGSPLIRSKTSTMLSSLGVGKARGRVRYDLEPISSSVPVYFVGAQRGRRLIRTHSPRPRSWREPSRELWPVQEEGEDGIDAKTYLEEEEDDDNDIPLLSRSI